MTYRMGAAPDIGVAAYGVFPKVAAQYLSCPICFSYIVKLVFFYQAGIVAFL